VLDLAGNAFAGTPDYNFATASLPINGTAGNDNLFGTEGDDTIDGGPGSDRMTGGLGDDTYYVDSPGDVVVEQPGGGIDHVIVSYPYLPFGTYVLPANVENLTLSNFAFFWLQYPINGTGNGLDNVLIGNSSANRLTGLGGADTLVGGQGADKFVYLSASDSGTTAGTRDVIQDFSRAQGDKIDLQAIDANTSAFGDQAFVFIGTSAFGPNATGQLRFDAGTHILYGSTDADADAEFSIELAGVTSLTATDFVL
jgi:Ca2+-binding RTX toxin-like protein